MKTVYVLLADGFEEIEALGPVDILRRAGLQVFTVGVTGKMVTGAHQIPVVADLETAHFQMDENTAMVFLPGGGTGTENLLASDFVGKLLEQAEQRDVYIAAICAAPLVLKKAGLLAGKKATAFPTVQEELSQVATVTGRAVEIDGRVITGRSAGVMLEFAHLLLEKLEGKEKADAVIASLYPEK